MVLSRKKLMVANISWCQASVITVKRQGEAAARPQHAGDPGRLEFTKMD